MSRHLPAFNRLSDEGRLLSQPVEIQLSVQVHSIPFIALTKDPLIVAEVESLQREFGFGSQFGRHTVREPQLQRRQFNLEPAIFDLVRIENLVVDGLFTAVNPSRSVAVVGPLVGERRLVLPADEVVGRPDRLKNRGVRA